ncbi:jg23066 [Pararge aegeria aegeria]|uniref:Jg23066 protein n=1 Tax=Pararge aegeria aegeria TaxID=348720 RepID=A0A8S4S5Y8_9NEOP|nr:jg23066 [Pararge aegeria aegeria]
MITGRDCLRLISGWSNSSGSSINSPLGPTASCGMAANPYAVPLYSGAPMQGYGCAPADLPHYGDMRGASWYPASNDPRFANRFGVRLLSAPVAARARGLTSFCCQSARANGVDSAALILQSETL